MFTITNSHSRDIAWPNLSLPKGVSKFPSRAAIPVELWPKLDRFRSLGLVAFEGEGEAGKLEPVKLETLSQADLYAMSKADLAELAKQTAGVSVQAEASKKALLDELVKKLPGYKPGDTPPKLNTGGHVDPAQAGDMRKQHDVIASARATRAVDVADKG